MAGETYTKRYGAGFVDKPTLTTPIDAAFLNAVETALLRLLGEDPAQDEVPVWTPGSNRFVFQKLTNTHVAVAAGIAYSKLALTGSITAADIAAAAGIAKSQLAALNLVNADIDAAAGIAKSKVLGWATYVTSLPGSPADGDEVYYLADATNRILWHLRYNASGGTYKWEVLGGTPLYAEVTTSETLASAGSYQALTTAGPSITVPLPGEYEVTVGSLAGTGTVGGDMFHSYDIGGTGAVDADATRTLGADGDARNVHMSRTRRKTFTAATTAIVSKYKSTTTARGFRDRWLRIVPLRVG